MAAPKMIEAIRANRWRQGSIFPASAHTIIQDHAPRILQNDDCCIVLSQSCDVVHGDLAVEPLVEVVVAKRLTGALDGTFTHAKNARRLQFLIEIGAAPIEHEALARERFVVPRGYLARHAPDAGRRVDATQLRGVITWILSRYGRQAFPDAFNTRTAAVCEKKVKPILKKLNHLKSLYVALDSWDELPGEKSYKVYLVGTVSVEDFGNSAVRAATEKGMMEIAAALRGCGGIDVAGADTQSEAQVTLDHLRNLVRWNLDYISLQDGDSHVFAGLDL